MPAPGLDPGVVPGIHVFELLPILGPADWSFSSGFAQGGPCALGGALPEKLHS
jgi:hypothetical protein